MKRVNSSIVEVLGIRSFVQAELRSIERFIKIGSSLYEDSGISGKC